MGCYPDLGMTELFRGGDQRMASVSGSGPAESGTRFGARSTGAPTMSRLRTISPPLFELQGSSCAPQSGDADASFATEQALTTIVPNHEPGSSRESGRRSAK